ncbi:hypothetical protein QC760_005891 [Botrytis cinerea]
MLETTVHTRLKSKVLLASLTCRNTRWIRAISQHTLVCEDDAAPPLVSTFFNVLFVFFFFQEIPPIVVFPREQGVWRLTFGSSYLPRQIDDQAMFTGLLSTSYAEIGD